MIALCQRSVISICPLLPNLFVTSLLSKSSVCPKFEPHWPSQSSSQNSQSLCPAGSFVKEVHARCTQLIWNFSHMTPHQNNLSKPSLSQIHPDYVRPASTLHFWSKWTLAKEVLDILSIGVEILHRCLSQCMITLLQIWENFTMWNSPKPAQYPSALMVHLQGKWHMHWSIWAQIPQRFNPSNPKPRWRIGQGRGDA